jgi:hypothetical protein
MAAIWSPLVQYPVDVSKDLLLIYNTNSTGSSNVCAYYLAYRPMVSSANVLGIGCPTNETISPPDLISIMGQIQNWLMANPTKRPTYIVLFQDIPSTIDIAGEYLSMQYLLNQVGFAPWNQYATNGYELNPIGLGPWDPFVTSINMNGTGGTNDCIAYIDKLANMASFGSNSPGQLFISATAGGYGNTNWYFDNVETDAIAGVTNVDPSASIFTTVSPSFTNNATNVAGYRTCGEDCTGDGGFATNRAVRFFGNSSWYVMSTVESFNGTRNGAGFQSSFLTWWATNSFGGTNYSNTPLGAITHVWEPGSYDDSYDYYADWASGKSFAVSAWHSFVNAGGGIQAHFQAVGDPFMKK